MQFTCLLVVCAVPGLSLPLVPAHPVRNIVKRSDDPAALLAVVTQHSSDIDLLKAQVATLQNQIETKDPRVAFLAQFSSSEVHAPAHSPYHFDVVKLNDGNGYNPVDGIFTAPMSGIYVFTVQVFTRRAPSSRPLVDLLVNGHTVGRMAFDSVSNTQSYGEDSDTMSFTVKLNTNDEVWTASTAGADQIFWGVYHSFFTGFMLYRSTD